MGDRKNAVIDWARQHPIRLIAIVAGAAVIWGWALCLSFPLFDAPYSTVLNDRDGQLLGARIAADEQWRFPPSDSLPEKFVAAIVAFEDKRFWDHMGVDVMAVGRATRQNWQAGRVVSGASTLTMQVVRMASGQRRRSLSRKLLEMAQATSLEWRMSKDEILQMYCAHAPFGGNIVGLEAASWRYYGVPAHQLSWGECASLAVLPNAPSKVLPGRNEATFRNKRNRLLDQLLIQGSIDSVTWRLSKGEPLPSRPLALPRRAPHLLDWQCQVLPSQPCNSTLDGALQNRIQGVVDAHVDQWKGNEVHNACAVAVDLSSGEIRAYAGNSSAMGSEGAGFDMLRQPRSTGSILKPLLYGAAIEEGMVTPQSILEDVPTRIGDFTPRNFDRQYRGAPSVKECLVASLNVPAVRLLRKFGLQKFHGLLQNMGIQSMKDNAFHYGLSLILGSAEIPPIQIAEAYAAMFSPLRPQGEAGLMDPFGRRYSQSRPQVFSPLTAFRVGEMMKEVKRPVAWQHWSPDRPVHWKTGTSYGHRDAWAAGTDGQWLVVVWAGNASQEGRPGLIGVECSAPLFFKVLSQLPFEGSAFPESAETIEGQKAALCASTGYGKGPFCRNTTTAKVGQRIPAPCSHCTTVQLNEKGERVHSGCASAYSDTSWVVLPPAMQWYHRRSGGRFAPLPPWSQACLGGEALDDDSRLEWVYPEEYDLVKRPRGLDGELQSMVIEVAHSRTDAHLFWHDNGQYLGETEGHHVLEVFFDPGRHNIRVVDERGLQLSGALEVVE